MKNNAKEYYLYTTEDYESNLHFLGWRLLNSYNQGKADGPHDWTNVRKGRSGSSLSIASMAIDANGNPGNFHTLSSSTSSSRQSQRSDFNPADGFTMSIRDLGEGRLIKVSENK